jgi:iron(III) transport system permease protein
MNSDSTFSKPGVFGFPLYIVATAGAFFVITLLPLLVLSVKWLIAIIADADALSWVLPVQNSLELLLNSLLLSFSVSILSVIFGTGLAFWLSGNKPIHKCVRSIYLFPLFIPPYIHSLQWMSIAGNRQFLNQLFSLLPGMQDTTFSTYGFFPAVLVLTLALFPIVTLLVRHGIGAIQPELLEAGWLGNTSWQVGRRIILPLVAPSIIASAGLISVLVMVEYGVPSLLQYNVYIMEVYTSFGLYFDPVRAFATALPLICLAVILLATSQLGLKNSPLQASNLASPGNITKEWPLAARILLNLCFILWFCASSVPLVILFIRGGAPSLFFETFINNWESNRLTVVIAALVGLLTSIIAIPLATALTQRISRLWWFIFALPLAIPAPLVGISMISIWNTPLLDWTYGTWLMLIFTQAARFLPFALFTASTGVRNIDPVFIEASRLPNIGFVQRMAKVTLPLLTPTILATWLITFIFSLGELGASLLVVPPGQSTLPVIIYNLLHYGATDSVAAMSLIIIFTAGIACAIMLLMYKLILRNWT